MRRKQADRSNVLLGGQCTPMQCLRRIQPADGRQDALALRKCAASGQRFCSIPTLSRNLVLLLDALSMLTSFTVAGSYENHQVISLRSEKRVATTTSLTGT
jgi:hypothetical protein